MWKWSVVLVVLCWLSACRARYHPERVQREQRVSGALPAAEERSAQYWYDEAARAIAARRARSTGRGRARNVIMFLGDGMSVPTLTAARTLKGQRQNRTGEEDQLYFESFPTVGLSKTYCVNQQIPDSACTATAYLCGVKNNYGTLGVTAEVPRHDCLASLRPDTHLDSIAAWALHDGRDVGIVTTTRITHASPGGAFAKTANRNWEDDSDVKGAGFNTTSCPDIAHQLVHMEPGKRFKVILGGGRRHFIPYNTTDEEGTSGRRTDNRNLINEWIDHKIQNNLSHAYVWNRDQLMQQMNSPPEYLLGLFEANHLQYNLEANKTTEPTLAELTEIAIKSLSRNERGFFLFVEGGRIDHAHHDNLVHLALDETLELSAAVERAAGLLPLEDTLLVVTADHAHVMAFNGYTRRGGDILGPSDDVGDDDVPYMTLSYTNGPGARTHYGGVRPNVLNDSDYGQLSWMTHAEVILESETHGGDDVAVFALGPHHDMFSGLYEQSQLPHLMAYAACIGPVDPDLPHCAACIARMSPLVVLVLGISMILRSLL